MPPGEVEREFVAAMSRDSVVDAYARWAELSNAEALCLDSFLPASANVIDVGCGVGRMLAAAAGSFGSYLGVDASLQMIDRARILHPGARFVHGDILALDLAAHGQPFNTALVMHNVIDMLHPLSRRDELLACVSSALEPGGLFIGSSHLLAEGRGPAGYCEEEYHGARVMTYRSALTEWIAEVEAAGFEVLAAVRDYRGDCADWAYVVARVLN